MEKIISNLESTLSNERKKHKRSLKEVLEENVKIEDLSSMHCFIVDIDHILTF